MLKNDLDSKIKNPQFVSPVLVKNKFAIYSTIENDPLFNGFNRNTPIFCGGKIINFSNNVYNLKKNEIIGYNFQFCGLYKTLSPNVILNLPNFNEKLVAILPYASYGMKILRFINPKIHDNILIIGYNFFSILLYKLIKLSGANVYILNFKSLKNSTGLNDNLLNNVETLSDRVEELKFTYIIQISEFNNKNIIDLLKTNSFKSVKKIFLIEYFNQKINIFNRESNVSRFDIGLQDYNYLIGIKYPYPYIRWDFKRNLQYFILLVKEKNINLNFFTYVKLEVNSIKDIFRDIQNPQKEKLILYEINE